MARFNADDVEHYGGQGGAGFFQLRKDHEKAKVRFMYRGIEDVQGDAVHQVKIDGKRRYVSCLRNYKDPKDVCPFCANDMFVSAKLFIPVYNEDEEKVQVWERGKTFFSKMSGICARYEYLPGQVFEIERFGKEKDTNTTYEIWPVGDADNTKLEDLPDLPNMKNIVLEKTAEDMEYYLETGEFPPTDDEEDEPPIRRRTESRDAGRRTPAGRSSDRF